MENRSFDHILGWQKELYPNLDGVTGQESNTILSNGSEVPIFFSKDAKYVASHDGGHSFQAIRQQVFGVNNDDHPPTPTMSGFAQQAESIATGFSQEIMSGFTPSSLPIYTELVKEFAVFDKWFASVPSSTQPNRQYVHSATSHGLMSNVRSQLVAGLPQRTIFDNLYDEGLSFGIYFQSFPSTIIYRRLRQLKYIDKFHPYHLSFKRHARKGTLPNYVVIEPRYFNIEIPPANDDHPTHDVSHGQALVKEVYETLRASPQWNEILFIITYDEHGGFYDHVPTPVLDVPNPDDIIGPTPFNFKFDRLGVRVPTIMVSPWIEKGTIIHEPNGPTPSSQYEHSSIPSTVKKLFNLSSSYLTKRDVWASSFEHVLTRTAPRKDCPKTLPSLVKDKDKKLVASITGALSEIQEDFIHVAASLNGELEKVEELIQKNVTDASNYVDKVFKDFLSTCHKAKKVEVNPSSIISLRPPTDGDGKRSYTIETSEHL